MRLTQKTVVNTMDGRFLAFLSSAYVIEPKINKLLLAKEVARDISTNRFHNSLPELLIDINKGGGVARPVPVFTPSDYVVYYFCIKKLEHNLAINRVDNTFGGWSLDGIIRHKEDAQAIENDDSQHSGINPAAGALMYGEFNLRVKSVLANARDDVQILEIDIANFYDSIRIDRLHKQVNAVATRSQLPVVDLLFYYLANSNKLLHSYRPQSAGIPQDMIGDCSRILANFYLQEYDIKVYRFCKAHGITYLRFADDQLFIVPKGINVTRVCREASKILYGLGLNINQKKVHVWTKQAIVEYRNIELYDLLDITKSNAEQTEGTCQKFAEESLKAIKKHRSKRHPDYQIKNDGLPLIKKIIGLNISKLTPDLRQKIIREIIRAEGYLTYLPEYNLTKLYRVMSSAEKRKLLAAIDATSQNTHHASFDYEVMKFKRNNGLKWRRHANKVLRITREWTAE